MPRDVSKRRVSEGGWGEGLALLIVRCLGQVVAHSVRPKMSVFERLSHMLTCCVYMNLKCILERYVSDMKETCGIHARYMRDTCILRGNQDTCGIHAEYMYMRDTWGIQYMRDTYLGGIQARPQVGLEISSRYVS